jgi:hypothetical protein
MVGCECVGTLHPFMCAQMQSLTGVVVPPPALLTYMWVQSVVALGRLAQRLLLVRACSNMLGDIRHVNTMSSSFGAIPFFCPPQVVSFILNLGACIRRTSEGSELPHCMVTHHGHSRTHTHASTHAAMATCDFSHHQCTLPGESMFETVRAFFPHSQPSQVATLPSHAPTHPFSLPGTQAGHSSDGKHSAWTKVHRREGSIPSGVGWHWACYCLHGGRGGVEGVLHR